MQFRSQKFSLLKVSLYFGLIFAFSTFFAKQNFVPPIYACTHVVYECCNQDKCQGGDCYVINNLGIDNEAECDFYCRNHGKFCCAPCADQCQYDSQCGSGCTCLADPNGNYCYCPGGGGGSGGGSGVGGGNTNHPPTCTISFPTDGLGTVLYDAKEYYDINGSAVVEQPTTRTGKINTTDPDGDTVTVQSLTVDRNCVQLSLNGTNFTLKPQGHATGVSPVDLVHCQRRFATAHPCCKQGQTLQCNASRSPHRRTSQFVARDFSRRAYGGS